MSGQRASRSPRWARLRIWGRLRLKRPRAMFFMPQPLISASLPPNFRHPPGDDRQVSATVRRKVRQARQVQTVIAEALADRDSLEVPRFDLATPADEAVAAARR